MKYRRREPEIVEAIQYDGTNAEEVEKVLSQYDLVNVELIMGGIRVVSHAGANFMRPGEWLVVDDGGRRLIVDPLFLRKYEPVEDR